MIRFTNRSQAGQQLAQALQMYSNHSDVIVIGLARGGVIVAYEVAKKLQVPFDIMAPRKMSVPLNPELAIGAVSDDGQVVWNESLLKSFHVKPEDLTDVIAKETQESKRRLHEYRGEHKAADLEQKTVIIVDDGIATGATVRAAIKSARARGAHKIIIAAPVAALDALTHIEHEADECIVLTIAKIFLGISAFYDEFPQVSDEQVRALLESVYTS